MKRVLVTGGGGLLGYAVKALCPDAIFVTRRDCDLTHFENTRALFRETRPDCVLHLAAKGGGVKMNANHNADVFAANIQINTNVLSAASEAGVRRLISILSSCAFRVREDVPSTEDDLHEGAIFPGNLGHGYAKRMLDIQTRLISGQYGLEFSTLTPVTMYGPNDNWDLETGHVVASLIHKCWLAKSQNGDLEVWGSGNAVRQFVFSFDVARILLQEMKTFHGPETLIVEPGQAITIRKLAQEVAKALDFRGSLVFDSSKPEGQKFKVIRSRNFEKRYPDFKFTPIRQSIRETVDWFIAHAAPVSTP